MRWRFDAGLARSLFTAGGAALVGRDPSRRVGCFGRLRHGPCRARRLGAGIEQVREVLVTVFGSDGDDVRDWMQRVPSADA